MENLPFWIPIFPYINPFTDEKFGEQKALIEGKRKRFLHVFIEAYVNSQNDEKLFTEHFFQKKRKRLYPVLKAEINMNWDKIELIEEQMFQKNLTEGKYTWNGVLSKKTGNPEIDSVFQVYPFWFPMEENSI